MGEMLHADTDVVGGCCGQGENSPRRLHVLHSTRSRPGRRMDQDDRKQTQKLWTTSEASHSRQVYISRTPLGLPIDKANRQ